MTFFDRPVRRTAHIRPAAMLALVAFAAPVLGAQQAPDRSHPPAVGPAPELHIPPIEKRTLSNGLQVWVMGEHKVPTVHLQLVVRTGVGRRSARPLRPGQFHRRHARRGGRHAQRARDRRRYRLPRRGTGGIGRRRRLDRRSAGAGGASRRRARRHGRRRRAPDVSGIGVEAAARGTAGVAARGAGRSGAARSSSPSRTWSSARSIATARR